MTAREYFEQARACQRSIDRRLAVLESMRAREQVRAQRYDAIGHGSGTSDYTAGTDARIDAERAAGREIAQLSAAVEDARNVCCGVRCAFDYQSDRHCSKTMRSLPLRKAEFDYQSDRHCSKTSTVKVCNSFQFDYQSDRHCSKTLDVAAGDWSSLITSQIDTAPKPKPRTPRARAV